MSVEIEIPSALPVMTLHNTVFFPHAMLPLYIFEPRYRIMLEDVLAGQRLFVVVREDSARGEATGEFEPAYPVASVGIVRACHQESDGTSHLILQGLARMRFVRIVQEKPYRIGEFEPLDSLTKHPAQLNELRRELARSVYRRLQLSTDSDEKIYEFLESHKDPEAYLDLASFTLCEDEDIKQSLLETLDSAQRYRKMLSYLRSHNEQLSLDLQLRGKLKLDDLDRN